MNIKKLYNFIFHEDSVLSWIVNVILAFIIVKFLIYPGLGFLLSTSHPLVAVVSDSMDHSILQNKLGKYEICGNEFQEKKKADFDEYWELCGSYYEDKFYIEKENFKSFSFHNGLKKGDIVVLKGSDDLQVGDIIVYPNQNYKYPIIHRVVKKYQKNSVAYYKTKGDHNPGEDPQDTVQVIGKAVFKIPKIGYIKILVVDYLLNPLLGR